MSEFTNHADDAEETGLSGFIKGLNQPQREAVLHSEGPLLVLAGPGSGKTTVITKRLKVLIDYYRVKPSKILVITFTKAAAMEMKERFEKMMNGAGTGVTFGTFHSVFFRILRHAYGYTAENIVRDEQKQIFFREIYDSLHYDVEDTKEFLQKLEQEISFVKGEGIKAEYYYPMSCPQEIFNKAYNLYESKMIAKNLIDFDDMQVLCYQLFCERKDILALWQKQYDYIEVDEVQDTNQMQYNLIRMLAAPKNNLMFVGDDDQSIYQFRGAKPEIMLNFPKDYPDCEKILLDINYRSNPRIVEMAGKLIRCNSKRFEKEIHAFKKDYDAKAVLMRKYETPLKQAENVMAEIGRLHQEGVPYSEIAVLFRTNTQPRRLVELLMRYNLPFQMRDVFPNIYEHWIARDIFTYIALAFGDRSREKVLQVINRPKRYVVRDSLNTPEIDFSKLYESYKGKDYVQKNIKKLEHDLKVIRKMSPYEALHYIRNVVGYEKYIEEYGEYRNMDPQEMLSLYDELVDSTQDFQTFEDWFSHIEQVKRDLEEQNRERFQKKNDAVALMTYHSSKGLEFDHVFLIDVNEGMTPYRKAVLEEELEEERRMFYVAFTRARKKVYLSCTAERFGKDDVPSRFLSELINNREDFREGIKVCHAAYGIGVVKKVEKNKIVIRFESQKMDRVLDLDFCIRNRILKTVDSRETGKSGS